MMDGNVRALTMREIPSLHSLVPRPRPEKSEEGLVTLAQFPAESAVLIQSRSSHFELPCNLLNSVTGEQRVKTDVVAVP